MSKLNRFLIVISTIVFLSVVLYSQSFLGGEKGPRMMNPSPFHMFMMLKAKQMEINISDNQMSKIKNKVFALEDKIVPLKNQENLNRLEMKKLMMVEQKKDYNKLKAVMTKMSEIRNTIFIETLKTMDDIKAVLTPQQQKELEKDMHKKLSEGMFPPPKDMRRMEHRDRGMGKRDINRGGGMEGASPQSSLPSESNLWEVW